MKDVFKEKYLKYDPSITLEIFTLVWNRLIELGYKSFKNNTVEERYGGFKGLYKYFRTTQEHPNEFSCYSNTGSYTETTVEEILGYNPFIKETKPSKDWSKATEEELLEEAKRRYPIGCKVKLIKYNTGGDFKNEVRFTTNYSKRKQLFVDGNLLLFHEGIWAEIESLPEIKTKEVIPEYIECIKPQSVYFIPGNIYKVLNADCIVSCKIISNIKCSHYEANRSLYVSLNDTSYFKPSTKEAFDAQNKDEEKSQFIVGKWYKCKDYGYVIKYFGIKKSENGDAVLYSDLINCDKSYKSYLEGNVGVGYTTNKYWYELTDLSEIQQYLPEGHPDKIKSNDFKVGDYVVITKSSKNWNSEMDVEVGKVVQITDISDTYINYKGKPYWSFGARDGHFRHATLIEINNHLISIGQIPTHEPLNNYVMSKKKYSIKDLETNSKLLIYIDSEEERDKIRKVSKRICPYYGKYCYSLYNKSYSGSSSKSCYGSYDKDSIILTIYDIIFEDDIKNNDKEILDESSIGKFISFRYNNQFYNKALIVKEDGNIYLLNNCYSNNNGHKDKSIYKYSLKYSNFYEVKTLCREIKFLTTEEPPKLEQQVLTPDWEVVPKFKQVLIQDWEVVPKRVTKSNEIEFTYLPEPD